MRSVPTRCCRRCAMLRRPSTVSAGRLVTQLIPRVINIDKARLYCSALAAVEKGRNPAPPLPTSTAQIFEQHPGAGSSRDQTPREG